MVHLLLLSLDVKFVNSNKNTDRFNTHWKCLRIVVTFTIKYQPYTVRVDNSTHTINIVIRRVQYSMLNCFFSLSLYPTVKSQ